MGIGRRLKEAREKAGLTQEELGRMIGVTGSAITNYEKETSHPKEPVMYALIDALDVEPNFLFQDCVNLPAKDINSETEPAQNFSPKRLQEAMGTMSCEEFAQKFQGSAKVISLYLSGKRKPTKVTAHLMAIYLGVNPDWLYGLDAPKYKKPAPEDGVGTFGQRLVASREKHNLSQKELAKRLGITPTLLNYWEKDKREPAIEMIKLISQVLDVDTNYLIGYQQQNNKTPLYSSEAMKLAADFDGLDGHGQRMVRMVADEEKARCDEQAQTSSNTTHLYIAARDGSRMEVEVAGELILPDEDADIPE